MITISPDPSSPAAAPVRTIPPFPVLAQRAAARLRAATAPLVLAVVFMASFHLVLQPTFGESFDSIPGGNGDMRLVNYVLEHAHQYFSGHVADFWNASFFYPHPNVLVLSENQVGAAPFYSAFRSLGLDQETSLQAWIITGFFLNYLAAAVVFRKLGFPLHLTALGACLFAFSVPQMLHLGHTQLIYRFPIPLAWYFAYRYLTSGATRSLALCGLLTCWQFYITPYFGFFLSLVLVVTVVTYAVARGDELKDRVLSAGPAGWLAQAGIAALCALLLVPILLPYTSARIPLSTTQEVLELLPRPQSYLMGSRNDYLAKLLATEWKVDVMYPWEHLIFPGLVTLLSVPVVWLLVAFRRFRERMPVAVWLGAITLCVLVLLTLTVREFSLYRILLDFVPAIRGIRGVTRISLVFSFFGALCVCWLLSLGFSSIRAFRRPRVQVAVVIPLWVFSTWESGVNLESLSKPDAQARVRRIVSDVGARTDADAILVTLQMNPEEPWYYTQVDSMIAAQALGITTMNGYSRAFPTGFAFQPAQCADVVSMADSYEQYVPGFRFEAVRRRLIVSPSVLDCTPTWNRIRHPAPIGDAAVPLDYRVSFEIQCVNCPTRVNEGMQFVVQVTNTSTTTWPLLPLALSGRLVRADNGEALSGFDVRVPLGQVLEAGGTAPLVLALKGPPIAGEYVLEADMVHENVTWFSQAGSARGRFPLRVLPQPPPLPGLITPLRIW